MNKEQIKIQVEKYPVLYLSYYHLWRKHHGSKVILPKPGQDLYFDGFPRSGSTYITGLINFCFPELIFSNHLHAIAGIKLAFRYRLPVFIIIREPLEAISSYYVMKNNERTSLNSLTEYFIRYYNYLMTHRDKIHFIFFPEWLENKVVTMNNFIQVLGVDKPIISEKSLLEYDTLMRELENKKDSTAGSFPNHKKNELKNQAKADIVLHKDFQHAKYLFDTLKEEVYSSALNYKSQNV